MFRFKNLGLFGCLLLAVCLTLKAPTPAEAEVTNRLTVQNNSDRQIDVYINGRLRIRGIPAWSARDCYPNQYGRQPCLTLVAIDCATGARVKQTNQAGRLYNFTWPIP